MESLVAVGAPINYTDADGQTALVRAAAGGSLPGVLFLFRHGAKNLYDSERRRGRALIAAEAPAASNWPKSCCRSNGTG